MHRAYAPSISDEQKHGRTDVTNGLRPVAEYQRNLTFRNARAHIRISHLALIGERADREAAS